MSDGLIFLLIAPSGSGKSSIIERILEDMPDMRRYITYTTRSPRPDEVNGREYNFIDQTEFERLRTQNKLVEWQEFYGHLYGSSKAQLEEFIQDRIDGIAAYDVKGSKELSEKYPENIVTIFIAPPNPDVIRERLRERYGGDTPEGRLRLERFDEEMNCAEQFEYFVINIDLEQATEKVKAIIETEQAKRLRKAMQAHYSTALSNYQASLEGMETSHD